MTMPATRAAEIWSLRHDQIGPALDGLPVFPLIDWINLFAPESELRKAVAKMPERVFPIPPLGDINA